jgi:Caspase domain/Domain of unknown function (DUF4384)
MKRRHFLQATGSTLSAIALNTLVDQANRYGQALAQSGPRKLAFLVGVNTYLQTRDRGLSPLSGCETDVQLQRELLIHRFGFRPEDIKILLNRDATRDNILKGFESHLIQQAKPNDIVVFHFSGHGSRLADPDPITIDQSNSALVPAGADYRNRDQSVNDIMGKTLFLLISALKTDHVTAVLDCCYAGGGTRGTERVRSDASNGLYQASAAEVAYQKAWMQKLGLTAQQLRDRRKAGNAKGVFLAAAAANQQAKENDLADISSGLFTYFLTQYLWESATNMADAEAIVKRALQITTGFQEPVFDLTADAKTKPIYFIAPPNRSAQAVVQSVQGNQATLWLGGLDRKTLEAFGEKTQFSTLEGTKTLTLTGRSGLTATATVSGVQPGTLLKESARVIPSDIKLRVGLDPSLGKSVAIPEKLRLEIVPARKDGSYSRSVHFILSRVTQKNRSRNSDAPLNSIALFSPSLELLPNSFEKAGETLEAAIARLIPKFQALVAAHLLRQTVNPGASQLNIDASLRFQEQPDQIITQMSTHQSFPSLSRVVPAKTSCQFQVTNQDSSPLYLLIALISPSGRFSIVFPNDYVTGDLSGEISGKEKRLVPDPNQGETFKIQPPSAGRGEALIVTSRRPLDNARKQLRALAEEQSNRGLLSVTSDRGVDAIVDLLSDLSRKSDQSSYTVSNNDVATISLSFNIV